MSALVSMDLNLSMGRVSTLMSVIAGSVAKFVLTQLAATNARVILDMQWMKKVSVV